MIWNMKVTVTPVVIGALGATPKEIKKRFLSRIAEGRGLISLRDVYCETKVRVACYISKSTSKWIRTAWERECTSQYCSIKKDAEVAMREVGCVLEFRGNEIICDGECLGADWKKMLEKIETTAKEPKL